MSFATAVNCMDGRTQEPVIAYLKRRCGVEYVDAVTEPGPVRILAEAGADDEAVASILRRVEVSVGTHGSTCVAVVAHADCAGNPLGRGEQMPQLAAAVDRVRARFPEVEVLGLWLGEDWRVEEVVV